MTKPVSISLVDKTITKIATASFGFLLVRKTGGSDYFITVRKTGEAEPTPEEFTAESFSIFDGDEIFYTGNYPNAVDVYMYADSEPDGNGSAILYFDCDQAAALRKI